MLLRRLCILALLSILATAVWAAKEKITVQSLMAKSDSLYYFPSEHALKDLAVDVVIDQLATSDNPVAKAATVSYYYAGDDKQRFSIVGLPDEYAKYRESVLTNLTPISQFIVPRTMASTFSGMTLKFERIARQLIGVPSPYLYQITGKPADEDNAVREYHVLLDETGLYRQVENLMKDKSLMAANVENIHSDLGWHISSITTRLVDAKGVYYKVENVEYEKIEGYFLPVTVTTRYRDRFNKPIPGMTDFNVSLQNYRLNTGEAAKALSQQ